MYTGLVRTLMLCLLALASLCGQTTQSIIRGRVVDSGTGDAIAGALVTYFNPELDITGEARTDEHGVYALTSLSPGNYRIRIEMENYQSRDVYSLDLHVSSLLELNADLRLLEEVRKATPGGLMLR